MVNQLGPLASMPTEPQSPPLLRPANTADSPGPSKLKSCWPEPTVRWFHLSPVGNRARLSHSKPIPPWFDRPLAHQVSQQLSGTLPCVGGHAACIPKAGAYPKARTVPKAPRTSGLWFFRHAVAPCPHVRGVVANLYRFMGPLPALGGVNLTGVLGSDVYQRRARRANQSKGCDAKLPT